LVYSALLTGAILAIAYWLVASATEGQASAGLAYCHDDWCVQDMPWGITMRNVGQVADLLSVLVLMVGCFLAVPSIVATTLAGERQSGTLDQLRSTPVPAPALLAGIVFGVPLRVYLVLVGPLALHLLIGVTGAVPLTASLSSSALLAVGALGSAVFAALFALVGGQRRGGPLLPLLAVAALALIAFVSIVLAFGHDTKAWSFLHPAGAINATYLGASPVWHYMNQRWQSFAPYMAVTLPALSMLFAGGVAAGLAWGAVGRLRSPEEPVLSPRLAFCLFGILAAALVLPFSAREWGQSSRRVVEAILVCGVFLLPVLAGLVTATLRGASGWAFALRTRGTVGTPWRLTAAMVAVFAGLAAYQTPAGVVPDSPALLWLAWTMMTLALFTRFVTARYATGGARAAFTAAIAVHFVFQLICVGIMAGHSHDPTELMCLQIGAFLGIAVPAAVAWRLWVLRTRTLAAVLHPGV